MAQDSASTWEKVPWMRHLFSYLLDHTSVAKNAVDVSMSDPSR